MGSITPDVCQESSAWRLALQIHAIRDKELNTQHHEQRAHMQTTNKGHTSRPQQYQNNEFPILSSIAFR